VVEAVEGHIERGCSPLEATEKAMDDVQSPVIAIALVLCAVFIPVAFMGGITGQLYRQFALTLSVSVVLSAIVALTLTPALCRMILRPRKESRGPIAAFFKGFNWLFGKATSAYTSTIRLIIRRWAIFVLLLLAIWTAAGGLLMTLPTGFVTNEDMGYFFVSITLPDAASTERTDKLTQRASQFIQKVPGVKRTFSLGGLNILNNTFNSNTSTLGVLLEPWEERKTHEKQIRTIMKTVQMELLTYPEAQGIVIQPPPIPGLGNSGGFQFEVEDRAGHTPEELDQVTHQMMAEAQKRPELTGIYTGYRTTVPELDIDLDRDKAKNMGISINTIFEALAIYLGGLPVNDFNLFNRTYKVMIQAESSFRSTPDCIDRIYVRSMDGSMIPLGTLAKVKEGSGPSLISRYNMYRNAEISGSAAQGQSSGQAMNIMEDLAAQVLPSGYGFEWSGTAFQEKLAGSAQSMIFILAVLFVFLFLAAQYESWAVPFSVLFGLPIGIFGAALAIYLLGGINNVYVQIGIVMLLGLAAKNAILIVEFAKVRYERMGMSLVEAAIEGAKLRFRPILMTSFAFIFGVLPLVIATGAGAASRRSLGTAVFAGMTTATCLGIFFIPMLYVLMQKVANLFGKSPTKSSAEEVQPPPADTAGKEEKE